MRPGDHVHVASLGKGIIREVRKGGRCLVDIKGRSILVEATKLSPLEDHPRRANAPGPPSPPADLPTRAHVPSTIDLHGMTTDEAVAALDIFLNDALLGGLTEVRVIHGRSGGRLKSAVHARVKRISAVRGYRVDPLNPGVTIVSL